MKQVTRFDLTVAYVANILSYPLITFGVLYVIEWFGLLEGIKNLLG